MNAGLGLYFGDADYCPASCCHMSGGSGIQVIIHGTWTGGGGSATACVVSQCVQTTPLLEHEARWNKILEEF